VKVTPIGARHVADVLAFDVDAEHALAHGALGLHDPLDLVDRELAVLRLSRARRDVVVIAGRGHAGQR
jgi:hypothetical protein